MTDHTAPLPDLDQLTESGLRAKGTDSILLIACGALAREILDLKQANGWTHMDLTCLPHCYSFFEGNDRFAHHSESEITTFYLTDFLVRQFEAFIIKPMGLDRHPQLRDMYFANYEKLVYQAQTDDPALTEKARAAADRLGLKFERRFTGYGDLATHLKDL